VVKTQQGTSAAAIVCWPESTLPTCEFNRRKCHVRSHHDETLF